MQPVKQTPPDSPQSESGYIMYLAPSKQIEGSLEAD